MGTFTAKGALLTIVILKIKLLVFQPYVPIYQMSGENFDLFFAMAPVERDHPNRLKFSPHKDS